MHEKFLLRPIEEKDLPQLLNFAKEAGYGLNLLSTDPDVMKSRIQCSLQSFAQTNTEIERKYFFILEGVSEHKAIGVVAIKGCIGHPWPFYKYKVSTLSQSSSVLNQEFPHQLLTVASDHQEVTEFGGVFLKAEYQKKGIGAFMLRSRCLFIADFPDLFSDRIISDLRGVSDSKGYSPFWSSLGERFFKMSYAQASHLKSVDGPHYMIELMPQHPIYVDLLSAEAQAVIGLAHDQTQGVKKILEKEKFKFTHYVDIFDAGPILEAKKSNLTSLVESRKAVLVKCEKSLESGELAWITNSCMDFRAIEARIAFAETGEVILTIETATLLKLQTGDTLRYLLIERK